MQVKQHYKLYKAGKLWMTAAIATIAFAGGLMMTGTKVSADTNSAQPTSQVSVVAGNNNQASTTQSKTDQPAGKSTQPGDQPTKPTDKPAQPGQPTKPTDKPTQPSDQPTKPTDKPADPGKETPKETVTQETATVKRTITVQVPSKDGKSTTSTPVEESTTYKRTVTTTPGKDGKPATTTATEWKTDKPLNAYQIPSQPNYVSSYTSGQDKTPVYATEIPAPDLVNLQKLLKDKETVNLTYTVTYVPGANQQVVKPTDKNDAKEKDLWLQEKRTVSYTLDGSSYGTPRIDVVWFKRTKTTTTTISQKDGKPEKTTTTYSDWQLDDANSAQYPYFVIKQVPGYRSILNNTGEEIQAIPVDDVQTPKNVHDGSDVDNVQKDANDTTIEIEYTSSVTDPINQGVEMNIKGNWASIDELNVEDNGIHVVGWNATNDSYLRNYHYVFVLDYGQNPGPDSRTSHFTEVGRVLVQNEVPRPDVKKVHNVWNAGRSGFDVVVPVDYSKIHAGDKLAIMSRWTSDPAGNNDDADLYGNYYTIDYNTNAGYLDNFAINNGKLDVSGWHASNKALGHSYRCLILWDNTLEHEVERIAVDNVNRPDVGKAYEGILGANQSGFSASFNTQGLDLSHSFQVISRYSTAANGEGDYVDYWFPVKRLFKGSIQNVANLDSFTITKDGLHVAGWNADDVSQVENHHFLILFDRTANQQIAAAEVPTNSRPDVGRAFPGIVTAGQSGFDYTFTFKTDKGGDLDASLLVPTHQYAFVSRYSLTGDGNGGSTAYNDYWMDFHFDNKSNLDKAEVKDGKLNLTGWHATSQSVDHPYRCLIVRDNTLNEEVTRFSIQDVERPDVANAYGAIFGSYKAGFATSIDLNKLDLTHSYSVISRYSTEKDGAGSYVDYWFPTIKLFNGNTENRGNLDSVQLTSTGLHVTGWNAADISSLENHHFLILVDQTDNNKELAKAEVSTTSRSDVAKAFHEIKSAGNSGFDYTFDFKSEKGGQLNPKLLVAGNQYTLISRYSMSGDGDGSSMSHSDYSFSFTMPSAPKTSDKK